jgi:hypothetical protein
MDFERFFDAIDEANVARKEKAVEWQQLQEEGHDPVFYQGRDPVFGRAMTQGGSVPLLSNVQPAIGQVGIGDGGFDVGSRRSPLPVNRRRSLSLDIVWAFSDFNSVFSIYSPRLGVKTFSDIAAFSAGIYRPSANSSAEDYDVYVAVVDEAVIGQPTFLVKKLNILTGISSVVLTINDQVPGFNSGGAVTFISNTAVSFYSSYLAGLNSIVITGHLYPSRISFPYPYEEGTMISGDTFTLTGGGVTGSGPTVWNGSWLQPGNFSFEDRLLGFDGNGNYIVRGGNIGLKGRILGQFFDLPISSNLFYSSTAQFVFSPRGDLNILSYPNEPFILPVQDRILRIDRAINLNGFLDVGQSKKVKIPSLIDERLLWVDVSPLELFDTGRGLNP